MPGWAEISSAFIDAFALAWQVVGYNLQHASWANPFCALFVVCAVCLFLECVAPRQIDYPVLRRRGFVQDLGYIAFIDLLVPVLGFYAATVAVEQIFLGLLGGAGLPAPPYVQAGALPAPLLFVLLFLLLDFVAWLGHYLLHRIGFLWEIHKIHHAQKQLGFASSRHFHWMEFLVFRPLGYIPFLIFGFPVVGFFVANMWVSYGFTFLSHSNVKLPWGFLKYLVITPDTHFWHHAKNLSQPYGVNFATVLVVWDQLFGLFHLPAGEKPALGIHNDDVPEGFAGQLLYPFAAPFHPVTGPSFLPPEKTRAGRARPHRRPKRRR